MKTGDGPFPVETNAWRDTASGGTRMTLCNRGGPSGFKSTTAPVMPRAMRRANRKDVDRLRQILESGNAQDANGAALPAGSRKRTRVPTAASSSQIDPPWASTIARETASPSPAPPAVRAPSAR
jgi:hypothetical protein